MLSVTVRFVRCCTTRTECNVNSGYRMLYFTVVNTFLYVLSSSKTGVCCGQHITAKYRFLGQNFAKKSFNIKTRIYFHVFPPNHNPTQPLQGFIIQVRFRAHVISFLSFLGGRHGHSISLIGIQDSTLAILTVEFLQPI